METARGVPVAARFSMRILYLSQYFPPEMGAPAARVSELSKRWAAEGATVSVVTTFPNHPDGVVRPEYRGRFFQREETDGYSVLRTWIYVTPNKGFVKRVVCFLSFMVSATFTSLFRAGSCDVVVATSPQIFCGLAGWIVSFLKRKPFVLEVRDLWPESAIQLGVFKNPVLIRMTRSLESFLYRRANLIVPVSDSIRNAIRKHGIPEERFETIPNGIDPNLFRPNEEGPPKRHELGANEKFLVSYIGTHGMAHGLETVVEAASLLRDRNDVHFVFIGDGARKAQVVRMSEESGLENIAFLPPQPKRDIPKWLAASDLSLVSLLNLPVFATVLPSKMFEIMACERPVLLVGEGECASLLEEAEAGWVLPPGNANALARKIEEIVEAGEERDRFGKNGREYVVKNFDRGGLADRYLKRLLKEFERKG